MIPSYFSAIWVAVTPAIANHLWQSTLFAVLAAILTLALRKNYARVRYRLWLAASIKFLVPFSLLISLGGHLARPRVSESPQSGLYSVVEELSQPFRQAAAPVVAPVEHASSARPSAPLATRSSHRRVAVRFCRDAQSMVVALAATLCGSDAGCSACITRAGSGYTAAPGTGCRNAEHLSRSCFHTAHWSPASLASFGQCWYGRRESRNTLRMRIWRQLSLMRYATCAVATISLRRCIW